MMGQPREYRSRYENLAASRKPDIKEIHKDVNNATLFTKFCLFWKTVLFHKTYHLY